MASINPLPATLLAATAAMILVFPKPLSAQDAEPTPTPPMRGGIWKADMPAGTYLVSLTKITSISQHEYIVEGAAKVSEVTIATEGSEIARFYYLEPNTPQMPGGVGQSAVNLLQEKAEEAAGRVVGDEIWRKVLKSYPVATHAHTIEYRLTSKDSLDKLFKSAEKSWLTGRGDTFKP